MVRKIGNIKLKIMQKFEFCDERKSILKGMICQKCDPESEILKAMSNDHLSKCQLLLSKLHPCTHSHHGNNDSMPSLYSRVASESTERQGGNLASVGLEGSGTGVKSSLRVRVIGGENCKKIGQTFSLCRK